MESDDLIAVDTIQIYWWLRTEYNIKKRENRPELVELARAITSDDKLLLMKSINFSSSSAAWCW